MPYADPEIRRSYANRWMKKRRADWVAEHGPCIDCGGEENLQVDHVDAARKVTHRVWSWARERREVELAKCVVRCELCHKRKSNGEKATGEHHGHSLLTTEQIWEVRRRARNGESQSALGREFGVDRRYVWAVVHRQSRIYE